MFDIDTAQNCAGLSLSLVGTTSSIDTIAAVATVLSAINAALILGRYIIKGIKAFRARRRGEMSTDDFINTLGGIVDDAEKELTEVKNNVTKSD